jgi:hypothetical protein
VPMSTVLPLAETSAVTSPRRAAASVMFVGEGELSLLTISTPPLTTTTPAIASPPMRMIFGDVLGRAIMQAIVVRARPPRLNRT